LLEPSNYFCEQCADNLPYLENACQQCALEIPIGSDVCGQCLNKPPPFDLTLSVFKYEEPISNWIHQLKYDEQIHLATIMGSFIAQHAIETGIDLPQAIICVPSHKCRLAERGFNQSQLIAIAAAKRLGIPYQSKAVRKTKHTARQASLSKAQRLKAQQGSFEVETAVNLNSVAIIDDVVTTGATIKEISKILKKNGVNYIQVWSFARR
jgi:ComF family protein